MLIQFTGVEKLVPKFVRLVHNGFFKTNYRSLIILSFYYDSDENSVLILAFSHN